MTLNGPEALRSLDEAISDIRNEEADIGKRLARGAERAAKLRESEVELFRQLAELRLDSALASETTAHLSRAEKQARDMLEQHSKQLAVLETELDSLGKRLADRAQQREVLLRNVDGFQTDLKALSAQIAQAIKKDPTYETKQKTAATLREIATESIRKTEMAEADQEQKGRPYREDPLFMYLWEVGYGTKNYDANNLFRWLDGLVARMVRYDKARPNFAMLNEIPLRLREHAERQIAAASDAEDEVDALETNAIDAAGGKPIRENLTKAQDAIAKIDAEILALEDELDVKTVNFRHLAEGQDPKFEEASRSLASSLAQNDIRKLWDDARSTPTPQDDAIIHKIEDARVRASQEDEEAQAHRSRLKILATRRRELEDIEFEFKKARFDDPRSTFREEGLAGDLLNEFLRGAITAATYWNQWQKSQHWSPGTTDWGGGVGLPRSGRSSPTSTGRSPWSVPGNSTIGSGGSPWGRTSPPSSTGGFSRPRPTPPRPPRSGSSGKRKGGGFKTGGGF